MPGMIVHQWLGTQLFSQSTIQQYLSGLKSPITFQESFYFGSIAPDLGMFPGGSPIVSNLAHYVRSGELCNNLVQSASEEDALGFAWGWVSHCLADILIHPLVNRGAGDLLGQPKDFQVHYAENPAAHVIVELGLDASIIQRFPKLWRPIANCETISERAAQLNTAYSATYGDIELRNDLAKSMAAYSRWSWVWRWLAKSHERQFNQKELRATRISNVPLLVGRGLTSILSRKSAIQGLFRAREPSEKLMIDFDRLTGEFLSKLTMKMLGGSPDMRNANLDTGIDDSDKIEYSLTIDTVKQLNRLIG